MYIYPDNLKAKATLFLWELRDIVTIGIVGVISAIILATTGVFIPLALTVVYGFLSISIDGISIMTFIKYGISFFIIKQQKYEWKL